MHDAGKVIIGLAIFVLLITFPIWFTLASGKAGHRPELELPKNETQCVESKEYMKAWHMDLLNDWRDAAVRDGKRMYVAEDGKKYVMSLSLTCLKCHTNKAKFCDECHNYVGVVPYCWDCHVDPKGD